MPESPLPAGNLPQDSDSFRQLPVDTQIAVVRQAFERAWATTEAPEIRPFLKGISEPLVSEVTRVLIRTDRQFRHDRGLPCNPDTYLAALPEFEPVVREAFSDPRTVDESGQESGGGTATELVPIDFDASEIRRGETQDSIRISHFRLDKVLGRGAFGEVYLGIDEHNGLPVAIKLAHPQRVANEQSAEQFLAEARVLAELQHPRIVQVLDAGCTDEGQCYVISQFIDGGDLAQRMVKSRFTVDQSAQLIATLADALHYAHQRVIVHRDIKPANILLDSRGEPYLADFGLALTDDDYGAGQLGQRAGSPAYMSPEQARGESHLVDGRTDIYALGVILYELLTQRRPFVVKALDDPKISSEQRREAIFELLRRIAEVEVRPLRQLDDTIPRELERICLKALSKRAADRYLTAGDLADDLRAFLGDTTLSQPAPQPARIIPRGLRSFSAEDAEFFLELLPGPHDRSGLPESLRFWKTRIEQRDADETFRVGLIYGPSGCGKSSLMKAGLLPRLAEAIEAVYVEATADETETRLVNSLRKRCPGLQDLTSLREMLVRVRRGQGLAGGRKLLLVIDQFEQWLHAQSDPASSELVQALRQCDGRHLQCIVMVREDFWMAVTRFLRILEISQVEGHNVAAVDLFPESHARKTLAAFGRAFGALGNDSSRLSDDQQAFVEEAVAGLAIDGRVICVRLALFAEMLKAKPWTPRTLHAVGGAPGLGETFLEETFSAASAPPEHRYHQQAARAVLTALLPDAGTDIKGHWKSRTELLEASGYAHRETDFDDLIRILDSEVRLITPTDPEGRQQGDEHSERNVDSSESYYQLTHDYLVPSLRDWLTRKQQETRRGRAELQLENRTREWTRQPINRRLPAWWEYLNIRWFTRRKDWTGDQARMMRRAASVHGARGIILTLLLTAGWWAAWDFSGHAQADTLVSSLLNAQADRIPELLAELPAVHRWAEPRLRALAIADADSPAQRRQQLHARLALVPDDPQFVASLVESLLSGPWSYVVVIRDRLPISGDVKAQLWRELRNEQADRDRRLKAAMALAPGVESVDAWSDADREFVVAHLLASNPEFQPLIRRALGLRRDDFLPLVEGYFQDPSASDALQQATTAALVDWGRDQPQRLTEAMTWARPGQWADLLAAWQSGHDSSDLARLLDLSDQQPDQSMSSLDRVILGRRRANAAIALALAGKLDGILAVMQVDDDPEALSQFAARCRVYGVELESVLACFDRIQEQRAVLFGEERRKANRALYGLLLSLGEYGWDAVAAERRESLLGQLSDLYANDPSSAVHGASGWLLRRWGHTGIVRQVDRTPVAYEPGREWYTVEVRPTRNGLGHQLASDRPLCFTFVVFDPGDYRLGSPDDEPERDDDEDWHRVRLTRPIAILDREITRGEYETFGATFGGYERLSATNDHPMNGPSWFDSVRFGRWLTEQSGLSESEQCYPSADRLEPGLVRYPVEEGDPEPRTVPLNLHGRGFRLPTESEWELAGRGGMRTMYGFGGDRELLNRYAWYGENSGQTTHVTGELRPNMRGLFDMHGNLHEWSHDWRGSEWSAGLIENPVGPQTGSGRVTRGGCWSDSAGHCRTSNRYWYVPSLRDNNMGFRLATVPVENPIRP